MHFELDKEYLDKLLEIIQQKQTSEAIELMSELHAADIAEIYSELSVEEAKFLFLLLEGEKAGDVLAELEDDDRERFMKALPSKVIAGRFIEYMDSDDAADVIADLPESKQEEVLKHIVDIEHAGDIVDLLTYDEDTAGGLMGKELIAVQLTSTMAEAIEEIRSQANEIEEVYYVYVTDEENVLKGALSLKKLLLAKDGMLIKDIYLPDVISVKVDMPADEVVNIADKYDLIALPVIDSIGRLVGRITIDDIVDVMREESDKDYQMIAGISEDIAPSDSVWLITRARIPWLFIGLIGGIFGAQVIGLYEADLAKHAAMAFFIPLIAAMGGNVGVQSSSIVVQSLANNTIGIESTFKKILKELTVAMINGLILSALILLYNLVFSDSLALTLTVSIALFAVVIVASILGTFIPLILDRYKIDPALATGPFITTANDIIGLFIYLAIGVIMYDMV